MKNLPLRIAVTLVFISLLGVCWWAYHLPPPNLPKQTSEVMESAETIATVEVDDLTPSDIEVTMAVTGYDDDGGILNEEPKK